MILLAIFCVLVFLLIANYEKNFILIIFISTLLKHFDIFGNDLFFFISLFAILLFPFKIRFSSKDISKFPFVVSFLFLMISWIVSNQMGENKHYLALISNCSELICVLCFWIILKKNPKSTIQTSLKYILIFGGVVAFYALYETISRTNPYINFVNGLGLYTNDYVVTEIRFGLKRSQSIFAMHTTNGGIALILFCLLLYAKQHCAINYSNKICNCIILLLLCTIFFTGSRAAIIGCAVCSLMFFSKKLVHGKFVIFSAFILLLIIPFIIDYFQTIYDSIIDTKKVGGSNADMRTIQFEIASLFLNKALWFGNGLSYTWEYVLYYYKELYGAESLWIPIMIDQGVFGVMSYVLLFINCSYFVFRNRQNKMFFFILSFFIFNTLSSIPNVPIVFIPIYLMLMIEIDRNYSTQNRKYVLKYYNSNIQSGKVCSRNS